MPKTPDQIKAQIKTLIELQDSRKQLVKIQTKLEKVAQKTAELDDSLAVAENELTDKTAALEAMKKQYRDLESEAKQQQALIAKSRDKLRNVKTNREYQAMLTEIDEMKTKTSTLEDQMLTLMEQTEAAEQEIAEVNKSLAETRERIETEKKSVLADEAGDRAELERLTKAHDAIAGKVAPEYHDRFMAILRLKGEDDSAVVPVKSSVCYGCHMNIPPQLFNELQRWDEVRYCPNCQRIIYWEAADA